ncbi:MAG: endonuclease, partial [Solirubrobacterales bacterium]|nr:endonuclease [Solirubrobacterales bacterium]
MFWTWIPIRGSGAPPDLVFTLFSRTRHAIQVGFASLSCVFASLGSGWVPIIGSMNSNSKGALVEAAIALEATRGGVEVFKPLSGHSRADLIFALGSRLYKVQCKSARRVGEVLCIALTGCSHSPGGYVRTKYEPHEIDLIAAHCVELKQSFLIPFAGISGERSGIQLRLSPPNNAQRAAVHFAADYEFSGAVAQLGERRHGMAEARGSSPLSSTSGGEDHDPSETVVGAHRFRNLFGHFMERAAGGESILVTRRGRPTVRLTPAAARPSLARAPHQVAATASMTDPA